MTVSEPIAYPDKDMTATEAEKAATHNHHASEYGARTADDADDGDVAAIAQAWRQDIGQLHSVTPSTPSPPAYLDHVGAALAPRGLVQACTDALLDGPLYGNPHSIHAASQNSSKAIDDCRALLLRFFNASPLEYDVVFTASATDALVKLAMHYFVDGDFEFNYLEQNHTSVVGLRDGFSGNNAGTGNYSWRSFTTEDVAAVNVNAKDSSISLGPGPNYPPLTPPVVKHRLIAFPAMCNFSGKKYPLEWISKFQAGSVTLAGAPLCPKRTKVLLDAAAYASTHQLNLSEVHPDFVCLSFYKLFGFPTGIGALFVRKEAQQNLLCSAPGPQLSPYFGGGGMKSYHASSALAFRRTDSVHGRLESGTCNFIGILQLKAAIEYFNVHVGTMEVVHRSTMTVMRYCIARLSALRHRDEQKSKEEQPRLVKLFVDQASDPDLKNQGAVVSFLVTTRDGGFVAPSEVCNILSLNSVYARSGCLCNAGACHAYSDISLEEYKGLVDAGYQCGGFEDVIKGSNKVVGAVRVSFGLHSHTTDVDRLASVLDEYFAMDAKMSFRTTTMASMPAVSSQPATGPLLLSSPEGMDHERPSSSLARDHSTSPALAVTEERRQAGLHTVGKEGIDGMPSLQQQQQQQAEAYAEEERVRIDSLVIYPIKSCQGQQVDQWKMSPYGLEYDRLWMIVDDNNVVLTQKKTPLLCKIVATVDKRANSLCVTVPVPAPSPSFRDPANSASVVAKNALANEELHTREAIGSRGPLFQSRAPIAPSSTFHLPLEPSAPPRSSLVDVVVCMGSREPAYEVSSPLSQAVSHFLGKPCRIVRQVSPESRLIAACRPRGEDSVAEAARCERIGGGVGRTFANEGHLLLLNMASARTVLEQSGLNGSLNTFIPRFRANIVVSGGTPFAEDSFRTLTHTTCKPPCKASPRSSGGIVLDFYKKCGRCNMICVDQRTGEKTSQPLLTLSKTRRHEGATLFGILLNVRGSALAGEQANEVEGSEGSEGSEGHFNARTDTIRVGDYFQVDSAQ